MDNINFLIERKIIKLGNLLISTRNKDLEDFGLTSNQSETLLFFSGHDGAMITDLKEHLKVSHQAAQKIVDRMREKHLLHIVPSKKDARAKNVYLTDDGRKLCTALKASGADVGQTLLSNLSEDEKSLLFSLLNKIK